MQRLAKVQANAAKAARTEPTAMSEPTQQPPANATADRAHQQSPSAPAPPQLSEQQRKAIEEQVVKVLKTIYDPEIPISIHELGLIYGVEVTPSGVVNIRMTLTAPACPVAESLPLEVESRVQAIPEVTSAVFSWQSNATGVATVTSSGLVSGKNAGAATITATTGTKSGTSAITVTP
jgi:metal-sulfur cluster biosynthetic enzyme